MRLRTKIVSALRTANTVLEDAWRHSADHAGHTWTTSKESVDRSWHAIRAAAAYTLPATGAAWMRSQAPAAWQAVEDGRVHTEGFARPDHGAVLAALTLLCGKGAHVLESAARHDHEVMAALAVLGIYQPQLVAVVAGYEAGKPAIEALSKLAARSARHMVEPISTNDRTALDQLFRRLRYN